MRFWRGKDQGREQGAGRDRGRAGFRPGGAGWLLIAVGVVALTNWAVSWWWARERMEIRVREARTRAESSPKSPPVREQALEARLNAPETRLAVRHSEAAQMFLAASAAVVDPGRRKVARSTGELVEHWLALSLTPPQYRYVSPGDPNNPLRLPLFVSTVSGGVYVPFWDRRYLVIGALPTGEDHSEAFFLRYPEALPGRGERGIALWMAPSLEHELVSPLASEADLRAKGWVRSAPLFGDTLTDLDKTRLSLDLIINERPR